MRPPLKIDSVEYRGHEIRTDQHGSWWVIAGEKVVDSGGMPSDYMGRPKYGSKALRADGLAEAQRAVDKLIGPPA